MAAADRRQKFQAGLPKGNNYTGAMRVPVVCFSAPCVEGADGSDRI